MAEDAAALRNRLVGVMVPLITPFAANLDVDWDAYDRHVEWLLAEGVRVLLAADLVGEAWALTMEEKALLFQRTARVARGRAVVVAKISEPALRSAAALAIMARDAGVDAVKVTLPAGIRPADEETLAYLLQAALPAGLPFLVESNGDDVSLGVLDRLVERPDFVGVEEAGQSLDRLQTLVERYGTDVPVICGAEDVLGWALLSGAAGFMTASPNFAPSFMADLAEAGRAADAVQTLALFGRLRRFRALLRADLAAGRPVFASYAKAALVLLGRPVGPPRPPLRPLTRAETAALAAVLGEELGLPVAG
ncbi:MAG: dihydrodipicolinate synthase family protein [Chloroflexota bacterium]